MKDFNKRRFLAYAKYDLNASRPFYRNVVFSIFLVAIGMMMLQVAVKWALHSVAGNDMMSYSYGQPQMPEEYHLASSLILLGFYFWTFSIGLFIMAGSWAHGMRNKKGRIGMLTLPVSSLEKYVWHTTLMVIGGLLTMLAALIVADMLNVVLTWLATGMFDWSNSTLVAMCESCNYISSILMPNVPEYAVMFEGLAYISASVLIVCACWTAAELMLFVLSNSIMFKFNVILTFVALSVLQSVLNTCCQSAALYMPDSFDSFVNIFMNAEYYTPNTMFFIAMGTLSVIGLAIAAGLYWGGYKLFCKAQICDKWNK